MPINQNGVLLHRLFPITELRRHHLGVEKLNNIFCKNLSQSREKYFRNVCWVVLFGGTSTTVTRKKKCKSYAIAGYPRSRITKRAENQLHDFTIFRYQEQTSDVKKHRI